MLSAFNIIHGMKERKPSSLGNSTNEAMRPVVYLGSTIWRGGLAKEAREAIVKELGFNLISWVARNYDGPRSGVLQSTAHRMAAGHFHQPDIES